MSSLTSQHDQPIPENIRKQLTLEEIDLLTRKCHHLHDEELLQLLGRFGTWLAGLLHMHHKHALGEERKAES